MKKTLRGFFEPEGVAIIGASANPDKLSHGILKNLLDSGFSKTIAPVNPKESEILGLKCYPEILEVPVKIDLAVIALPAPFIPAVLENCGKKGIHNVTVISGGFREVGGAGKDLEEQLLEIGRKYNIRIIGPNCVGTVNLIRGLNTTFINGLPAKGGIGLISQSGAVCGGIVDLIGHTGIGFSHIFSLGNAADVNETDMIEYLADDADTHVIAAYIEGIQDGVRFMHVARDVTKSKPIVVLKAGKSEQGAKAVSSHTGSLAGSQNAYKAAFAQAGVIEVATVKDLLNVSNSLDWLPGARGNRIAIVTNSGGPAALASDFIALNNCELAEISDETQKNLREILNPAAQVENPIDMLGGADESQFGPAVRFVLQDPNVDMVLAILVPTSLVNPVRIADAIINAARTSDKPVLSCFMGYASTREAQKFYGQQHMPLISYPEQCGPIFKALLKSSEKDVNANSGKQSASTKASQETVRKLIKAQGLGIPWGEHLTRPILDAYGIPIVEGEFVEDTNDLAQTASRIGYPLVLKIASRDVLHKSDLGGIIINIEDENGLVRAAQTIQKRIHKKNPEARLEGFLVEKMVPEGQEVIVGFKHDPTFGPLLMFGLGGIFVELFRDVAFRLAPIDHQEALNMVKETNAYKLLSGWRGGKVYDIEAIIDAILKINQIAVDHPVISELEINPLMVFPKHAGASALDCRMILK